MYNVGDFVVNGNFGVCEITFIGKKEGMEGDYYGISPVFQKGVNIVMRVDGSEKFIRPVMSRERAENVIGYKRKGEYKFRNDKAKLRTGEYREMLFSLSDVEWAELAVEQRRYSAKSAGSSPYLKTAKENLFGELSFVLGKSVTDVEKEFFSYEKKVPSA